MTWTAIWASSTPRSAEPPGVEEGAHGPAPAATITFLSDYGLVDGFVGEVHLVIAAIAPGTRIVDLGHLVPAYDVAAGARLLVRAAPWLGDVVLAVVDPVAGTSRRPIAVEALGDGNRVVVLVGPDNGLLLPAARAIGSIGRAVELDTAAGTGPGRGGTFDGRDLFAPVAARLSAGVAVCDVGLPVDPASLVEMGGAWSDLEDPAVVSADGSVTAVVRWVDRFGNAQLNLAPHLIGGWLAPMVLQIGDGAAIAVCWARTYQDIPLGAVGLVIDAQGWVSLACPCASAAATLGVGVGTRITLNRGVATDR